MPPSNINSRAPEINRATYNAIGSSTAKPSFLQRVLSVVKSIACVFVRNQNNMGAIPLQRQTSLDDVSSVHSNYSSMSNLHSEGSLTAGSIENFVSTRWSPAAESNLGRTTAAAKKRVDQKPSVFEKEKLEVQSKEREEEQEYSSKTPEMLLASFDDFVASRNFDPFLENLAGLVNEMETQEPNPVLSPTHAPEDHKSEVKASMSHKSTFPIREIQFIKDAPDDVSALADGNGSSFASSRFHRSENKTKRIVPNVSAPVANVGAYLSGLMTIRRSALTEVHKKIVDHHISLPGKSSLNQASLQLYLMNMEKRIVKDLELSGIADMKPSDLYDSFKNICEKSGFNILENDSGGEGMKSRIKRDDV